MRTAIVCLALGLVPAPGVEEASERVHNAVREIMSAHDGRAVFSDLYNSADLSTPKREYASRLYEVFFALPAYLSAEQRATGHPPRAAEIADNFGLPAGAAELLLEIIVSDPRLPKLLTRDASSGEIVSLDLAALDAFAEKKGTSVQVAGWAGEPLPDFALTTLDGQSLRSVDLEGKPTLIFLWLTRCPVCRRVTPDVVALDRLYRERGLRVIGLCADDVLGLDVSPADRRKWLRDQDVGYPNAVLDSAARAALGNQNIFPAFFLVAADGTVARLVINEQSLARLKTLVEELID